MNDLMVDLETLGTTYNAPIVQIGAVYFDRYTGQLGNEFSVNIRLEDCLEKGFRLDGGALKFWFEQGTDKMTWMKNPVDLSKALQSFRDFVHKDAIAWAHATFDFPILANSYKTLGQGLPFHYRAMRDLRTLVDLAQIEYKKHEPKEGEPRKTHDALDDCKFQVVYAVECFNKLRSTI